DGCENQRAVRSFAHRIETVIPVREIKHRDRLRPGPTTVFRARDARPTGLTRMWRSVLEGAEQLAILADDHLREISTTRDDDPFGRECIHDECFLRVQR